MEVLSFCFIALATVLLLWFVKLTGSSGDKNKPKKRLPPGPWTLPVIGSLHHVFSILPHRTLTDLSRRHGPLMYLMFGEVPNVVVSSAEAAELALKTHDLKFATRPRGVMMDIVTCGGKGIIFSPYNDHWRQMRKVCIVELLSAKQVKRMESIRVEEVSNLVRSVAASASSGRTIDLREKLSALSNDIIARAVFSSKCTQQSEYTREFGKVLELLGGFCLADLFPSSRLVRWLSTGERQMKRSYGHVQRILASFVQERKAARAADGASITNDEDFLDVLLRLQEENLLTFPITSESIGVVLFDMIGAGSVSSSSALEWAMSELLNNPKAMARVQLEVREALGQERDVITNNDLGELHFMRKVIKEVFRMHPPGPLLPREAREDCEIMGYDIPKGTKVLVNVFAVSRDPRKWDNPDAFMPERFENNKVDYKGSHFEFTPFGAGQRQCPGMLFGTSTMEIALASLLYHFDWVLPDGANPKLLDMSEKFGITVGRKSKLQLRAIPRVRSKAM